MRICHLTTVHDWNDVRIYVKMCRSAVADGFRVDLVAPVASNNPVIDSGGVTVHALRKYRNRLLRSSLGTLRAIRKAVAIPATIYHVHDPELLPAVFVLRLSRRRIIFDFHEEFSAQIKTKPYLGRWSRMIGSRLARCWELLLCYAASRLVTATPRIRDRLPIRQERAAVVCNYPSLKEFAAPTQTPFSNRSLAAYYVGGITEIRGCFEMIHAARILTSTRSGITIRIAGPFDSVELERKVRQASQGLNVEILGRRSRDQVMGDLEDTRVALVIFKPGPNHWYSLPNKLFEYMAAGVPVVASDFPLWKEVFAGANCGLTIDSRDPKKIADAIAALVHDTELASRMGEGGRRAVETKYQWNTEWRHLRRFYERVGGGGWPTEASERTAPEK